MLRRASTEAAMASVDGDSIVRHFLTGDSLRRVFAHLCNHASGQVTDPISDVVHTMLTCPVQMVISEVGVALFKDHPNALFPFSAMDAAQRQYVEGVVAGCMSQFQQRDACAAAGVAQQPPVSANVVMQMGGGCILYAENAAAATRDCGAGPCGSGQRRPSGASFLRSKDVFETLCDCIFASRRYGAPRVRYAVCSLVLQRVVGMTHVPKPEQQAVHTYALALLQAEEEEGGI